MLQETLLNGIHSEDLDFFLLDVSSFARKKKLKVKNIFEMRAIREHFIFVIVAVVERF